jgi:hypothetical protein
VTDLERYSFKSGNYTRGKERRGGRGPKPAYAKGVEKRLSTVTLSLPEYAVLESLGGISKGVRKLIKAHLAAQAVNPATWDDVPALLKPQAD